MENQHADSPAIEPVPSAEVVTARRGLPLVWLVPLLALAVGAWLVYKTLTDVGPVVTLYFSEAEGIEPKKTRVKYRSVDVGLVIDVRFADDRNRVEVLVELEPGTETWLTENTRFWVVRPRLEITGVTGLGTLLTGTYIGMDPGEGGMRMSTFTALEEPPTLLSNAKGTLYQLRAPGLGSISIGSPVYFRQFDVGEVVQYRLAEDHSHAEIDIFIRAPHDQFVKRTSRFWNASGANLDVNAGGVEFEVQSLAALLAGGIAFETPNLLTSVEPAPPGHNFTLYESKQVSEERPITVAVPYLLYFNDTVRGLKVGAPVEFRGIRIGTVKDISIEGRMDTAQVRIPVLIEIEPDRVILDVRKLPLEPRAREERVGAAADVMIDRMIANGLRARLETANLLTGQLFVEFDIYPDEKPAEIVYEGPYAVLPTIPNSLSGIADSLSSILKKLEALPVEEIGQSLQRASAGADRLVNNTGIDEAAEKLAKSLEKMDLLLSILNEEAGPLLQNFTKVGSETRQLIKETRTSVERAEAAFASAEAVLTEQGPIGSELKQALEEVSAAARSLRIITEYLERHPEALLKGKGG
ncbi:MAG: MlaD family protein [Chromatiaceae bacterium]|nr:MlaD family protein [Chromatiaceae bacterium]